MSPSMPPRLCPKCQQLSTGQCRTCRPAWGNQSPSSRAIGGRPWRRLRAAQLKAEPLCQWPGCVLLADQVDHVVPVAAGGAVMDAGNLQSLCAAHHREKTQTEGRAVRTPPSL